MSLELAQVEVTPEGSGWIRGTAALEIRRELGAEPPLRQVASGSESEALLRDCASNGYLEGEASGCCEYCEGHRREVTGCGVELGWRSRRKFPNKSYLNLNDRNG
jgi:hypothetical protein